MGCCLGLLLGLLVSGSGWDWLLPGLLPPSPAFYTRAVLQSLPPPPHLLPSSCALCLHPSCPTVNYRLRNDHLIKLSISHALAQSAKLSVYEDRVIEIVENTKDLPETLAATGEVRFRGHGFLTFEVSRLGQTQGKTQDLRRRAWCSGGAAVELRFL